MSTIRSWMHATRVFVVVVVLVVGVYDLVAVTFGGPDATISHYAPEMPTALIFALGFVFGHMFWSQKPRRRLEDKE